MQEVVSAPDDDDDEDSNDAHLFIDWRNAAAVSCKGGSSKVSASIAKVSAAATGPSNLVCLNSDSDSESDVVISTRKPGSCADARVALIQDLETAAKAAAAAEAKPLVVGVEAAAPAVASKRKRSAEEREQDKREEKQRKAEQKKQERELRRKEKEAQKQQQQEAARKEREADKLRKAEVKAKAAAARKLEQEKGKWEKGKFALENTVALIDCKVIESSGLIGGQLVSRFKEKGLKFHLVSNLIERSVLWRMKRPSQCSHQDGQGTESDMQELQFEDVDAPYVLLVFEPEEFSALISNGSHDLDDHVRRVRSLYPGYTVCYLVNKLMSYLQKKDQQQYKNGTRGWVRPNAEKACA